MDYFNYLKHLSGDDWRTVSIVAQGVLMMILVSTGIYQLLHIRAQAKRSASLEICDRYSTDPILYDCKCRLRDAFSSGDLAENPKKYIYRDLLGDARLEHG